MRSNQEKQKDNAPVVAHVIPEYLIAAQSYIYRQLFDHQGFKILVITKLFIKKSKQLFPIANLKYLTSLGFIYGRINRFNGRIIDWLFEKYIGILIKLYKVSILHIHFGTQGAKLAKLRKKWGIPMLVYFYGSDTTASPLKPEWKSHYQNLYNNADIFMALAEGPKKQLIDLGAPADKIRIVHLSADIDKLPYIERDFTQIPTFLILARLIEKKGHLVLLDAFKDLIRSGFKAKLIIAGYGDLDTVIDQVVKENNIKDWVEFHNTKDVVDQFSIFKELLYRSTVFVLPSIIASDKDSEGTPITIMEASASGLPIISTWVAGIPEVVLDHKTGLLVEQRDVAALAQAMRVLGSDPELCRQYAKAGREHIENNFSTQSLIKNLDQIYEEVLTSS